MQTKHKVLTTAVIGAVVAFALAPQTPVGDALWPDPNHDERPTGAQVPLFMLMGAIESLATGLGVGYLLFGMPYSRALAGGYGVPANAVHVSIAWLLGNWWLHDNLHYVNGLDMGGLLVIDYLFHGTLIVATVALVVVGARRARALTPGVRGA